MTDWWSDDEVEFIKKHVSTCSRAQLARSLNEEFGTSRSRNAIIGKVKRMQDSKILNVNSKIGRPKVSPIISKLNTKPKRRDIQKVKKTKEKKVPPKAPSLPKLQAKKDWTIKPSSKHRGLPAMKFGQFKKTTSTDRKPSKKGGDLSARRSHLMAKTRPEPLHIPLVELDSNCCKYGVSEVNKRHMFCGVPSLKAKPYCPYHMLLCVNVHSSTIEATTALIETIEAEIGDV